MILTRSLFMPTAIALALSVTSAAPAIAMSDVDGLALSEVEGQDKAPSTGEAHQPPPIQARPGTPEGTPRTDQTVDVTKGTRLVLSNNAGEVVVTAWDRSAVRVQANHSTREKIDMQTADAVLRIRNVANTAQPPDSPARAVRRGPSGLVDYRITVPSWMPVNLSGTYLDADISGTAAEVTVETVGGSIRVSGGSGAVSLRSVEGRIVVEKTTGRVQATGVNEGIRLSNTQGEVIVDTTNGDIFVDNAQTSNLEVSTVNGDVTFNGTVRENGIYKLSTHSGDIRVGLGGATNAIVFVRTFQGDFSADFPIQLPEGQSANRGSKRFNFTLGGGSARIELQSFNGDIHLARGTVTSRTEERERRRLIQPPKPPTPPTPPKPPKDLIDAEALRELAKIDKDAMKLAVEKATKDIDKLDFDFDFDFDFDEIHDAVEHSLERMLELAPPPPPAPAPPTTPPTPPAPRRP